MTVLGRIGAIVACIILGAIGGYGWRRKSKSRNTSHADRWKTASTPVVRSVIIVTVSTALTTDKARIRMLLVGHSVVDISGVEGEVGGVGQESFSVAPAHIRSHTNDDNDQTSQSSETKNKPGERFIIEEGLFGFRSSARGGTGGRGCFRNRNWSIRSGRRG